MNIKEMMIALESAAEHYTVIGIKAKTSQRREVSNLIAAELRTGYLLIKDTVQNNGSSRQSVINSFDRAIAEICSSQTEYPADLPAKGGDHAGEISLAENQGRIHS